MHHALLGRRPTVTLHFGWRQILSQSSVWPRYTLTSLYTHLPSRAHVCADDSMVARLKLAAGLAPADFKPSHMAGAHGFRTSMRAFATCCALLARLVLDQLAVCRGAARSPIAGSMLVVTQDRACSLDNLDAWQPGARKPSAVSDTVALASRLERLPSSTTRHHGVRKPGGASCLGRMRRSLRASLISVQDPVSTTLVGCRWHWLLGLHARQAAGTWVDTWPATRCALLARL